MPMTTILVELDSTAQGSARLDLSARLAARHDAHLIGLFVIPPFEPPMMFPGAIGGLSEIQAEYRERALTDANTVQGAFESALEQNGVAGEWRCLDGFADDVIVTHARYADLVVVGQADPDRRSSSVAGEVTLRAGRPVLVVPYTGSLETLAERPLVAWNASREATRAVTDALPLLARAKEVIVLSINPGDDEHIPGAEIATFLARHGVKADARQETAKSISEGDNLLSRAAEFGADMIVMGAYGHSRAAEFVFGGTTRDLLQHSSFPLFLSH
jgi:nucleotide-binding universal stress UspA family protein